MTFSDETQVVFLSSHPIPNRQDKHKTEASIITSYGMLTQSKMIQDRSENKAINLLHSHRP